MLTVCEDTAWSRQKLSESQRFSLWRVLRVKLTRFEVHPLDYRMEDELTAEKEAKFKYDILKNIFWIRLSDFLDIIPRYPHLQGVHLRRRPMALDNEMTDLNGSVEAHDENRSPTSFGFLPSPASVANHANSVPTAQATTTDSNANIPNGIH